MICKRITIQKRQRRHGGKHKCKYHCINHVSLAAYLSQRVGSSSCKPTFSSSNTFWAFFNSSSAWKINKYIYSILVALRERKTSENFDNLYIYKCVCLQLQCNFIVLHVLSMYVPHHTFTIFRSFLMVDAWRVSRWCRALSKSISFLLLFATRICQ